MKVRLTTKQSKHLIDLGIPKEKAKCELPIGDGEYVFILTDLLEILPKEIEIPIETYLDTEANLVINGFEGEWSAEYEYIDTEKRILIYKDSQAEELIDALYELTCWYYGEYLKSEKK